MFLTSKLEITGNSSKIRFAREVKSGRTISPSYPSGFASSSFLSEFEFADYLTGDTGKILLLCVPL